MLTRRDLASLLAGALVAPHGAAACASPDTGAASMRSFKELLVPPYMDELRPAFEIADRHPFEPDATGRRSPANAWWLAEAATLAYASDDRIRATLKRVHLESETVSGTPQTLASRLAARSTRGFIAHDDRYVIVAFCGTEFADAEESMFDYLVDFAVGPLARWEGGGRVHLGFRDAFATIFPEVDQRLRELAGDGQRSVWFTGHSLGAAIATLAAAQWWKPDRRVTLYTFGSPRVGDAPFVGVYRSAFPTHRFVHGKDIVARVPPTIWTPPLFPLEFAFEDLGDDPVYFTDDGQIVSQTNFWSELPELTGQAIKRTPGAIPDLLNVLGPVFSIDDFKREFRCLAETIAVHAPQAFQDHAPVYYMDYLKHQLA